MSGPAPPPAPRPPGRPLVLGLTGSIGMGKSTIAAMLEELGVPVFDADAQVRALQAPAGALVAPIEAAFPGTTEARHGVLREELARRVFGDPAALARLEAIVHPAIAAARRAFVARHAAQDLVALDVPLLLETGALGEVDKVLLASAPAEVQRARVLARPGMSEERLAAILARQMPDAQKRACADYVIATDRPIAETRAQVARAVAELRAGLRQAR